MRTGKSRLIRLVAVRGRAPAVGSRARAGRGGGAARAPARRVGARPTSRSGPATPPEVMLRGRPHRASGFPPLGAFTAPVAAIKHAHIFMSALAGWLRVFQASPWVVALSSAHFLTG
eukprot:5185298-Alexandrium_andersonii.AAC.1